MMLFNVYVSEWQRKVCLGKLHVISRLVSLGKSNASRLAAGDPFPGPKMVVWFAKKG